MKLFGIRSLSTILFWIALLSLISWTVLFIVLVFELSSEIKQAHLPSTILMFLSFFVFLLALVFIFSTFKRRKIFTSRAMTYLRFFTILNLCMPLVYIIMDLMVIKTVLMQNVIRAYPFIIIAVFSAFLTAILKQGFQIQTENDLTI